MATDLNSELESCAGLRSRKGFSNKPLQGQAALQEAEPDPTSNAGGSVEWENWDTDTSGQNFLKESDTDTFTIADFIAEELPSTKGWMWFDLYPWVYSHVEGDWLYFQASGSTLMIYSAKDGAWREME